MKRLVLAILVLGMFATGLVGCHAEAGVDPNQQTHVNLAH